MLPRASRLVLHVMAAFAEHKREMIRERTKAALAAAKARGVRLGANGAVLAERHKSDAAAFAHKIGHAVSIARIAGARTTQEIADHLNAIGVPSRQSGRWYPANVARVTRRLYPRSKLPGSTRLGLFGAILHLFLPTYSCESFRYREPL
ncbi:MAG TPA: recombinase family protein [Rhizomicrobium sp.]